MKKRKLDMSHIDDDLLLPLNRIWWDESMIEYYADVIDSRNLADEVRKVYKVEELSPYYEYQQMLRRKNREKYL
tara:strand:+ start:3328 stop:3549 length:222 start_codon:yes stop_codon:yes gene_type:complete